MSLEDDLLRIVKRQRVYASLHEGGSKEQKELSIAGDFLASLRASTGQLYEDLRLAAQDPPDCTICTASGLNALELTEFVSQEAILLNEQARPAPGEQPALDQMVMARWDEGPFIEHLRELLAAKDSKVLKGGPYSAYIVLAYTDEPLLLRATAEEWLRRASFGPFSQITSAWFMFSYEPGRGYPVRRLFPGGT